MHDKLKKAFQKAKYETSVELEENIWHTISLHQKQNAQFKLYTFTFLGITSLIGLIPAIQILSKDLMRSSFFEYFSLLFSGNRSISFYWQELTFSLAESLPTISIILTLSLVFIFLLSLKHVMKQIINNNSYAQGSLV